MSSDYTMKIEARRPPGSEPDQRPSLYTLTLGCCEGEQVVEVDTGDTYLPAAADLLGMLAEHLRREGRRER